MPAKSAAEKAPEPDLSKPLVLDTSAFSQSDMTLRTDLTVAFGDGVHHFELRDQDVVYVERRMSALRRPGPGGGHFGGRATYHGPSKAIGAVYADLCRGRALFKSGAPIWAGIAAADPAEAMFSRDDLELVIGWGLVGGGMPEDEAGDLVERYVSNAPLLPLWTLAFAILGARLFGREPEPAE